MVNKENNNLRERFHKEITQAYQKEFGVKNKLAVPAPTKVVVNIGVGDEAKDAGSLEKIQKALTQITGQKAVFTRAKKSIAGFGVRQGEIVGVKVTLRGQQMWDFLDKMINVVLPRVKDFRGIDPNKFDRAGNYTLSLVEYYVFPEINPVEIDKPKGVSIAIVFKDSDPKKSRFVMEQLGFVFKKKEARK